MFLILKEVFIIKTITSGVWPVMITPFTKDNKVDYDAVLEIIKWYEKQGVDGIFAMCQSSEMFFLTREERLELTKFVVDNTPEHIGIIASGHVADNVEDQIEEAKALIETGIDAYVFISNRFGDITDDEETIKKNIETLINQIGGDNFGIYECPHPYKRLISPELLKWCADTGRFKFLKDTCCDIDLIKKKLEAVEGTDLKIFNANAAYLLDSLKLGVAGYSGIMANFHADLYSWLCKNFENNPEKAEEVQQLLGAMSVIECQVYPVNAKYHMLLEGLDIHINSRVQDESLLTPNRQKEVQQMREFINLYKKGLL